MRADGRSISKTLPMTNGDMEEKWSMAMVETWNMVMEGSMVVEREARLFC